MYHSGDQSPGFLDFRKALSGGAPPVVLQVIWNSGLRLCPVARNFKKLAGSR